MCWDMFRATGVTFEQEHLRFMSMITAARGAGVVRPGARSAKNTMEHKVAQSPKAVNADESLFRQWRQTFTAALGQVKSE